MGYEPKKVTYVPEEDKKGAVIHLHGNPSSSGVITDLSGNGNNGTLNENISFYNDGQDIVYENYDYGDGRIEVASNASWQGLSANTIQMCLELKSSGEGGSGYIWSSGPAGNINQAIIMVTSQISTRIRYTDGLDIFKMGPEIQGHPYFLQITQQLSNPLDTPSSYINGYRTIGSPTAGKAGSLVSTSGDVMLLGNRRQLDSAADVKIKCFKMYPSILSADDLRDEYIKFALGHVHRPLPRTEHAVTTGAVAAPAEVGPWQTWAGSHQWLDDGTDRYLLHDSTAKNYYASIQSKQAYGFWYVKYKPGAGGSFVGIPWTMSSRGDSLYSAAAQTGYYLSHNADGSLQLYRMTGGGTASIATTVASWLPLGATDIEIGIARRLADGQFTVYTKESNHTTWTQAIQAIDTNVTTCNYFQNYTDVNGYSMQFKNLLMWPYGDTLLPTDIPEIA